MDKAENDQASMGMTFTLLQWNILYSEDIEAVAEFIRGVNPDIVCLQELTKNYREDHPDTGKYLCEALGYYGFYEYGPMALPDGGDTMMGNGLFSRYPIIDQRRVVLQEGSVEAGRVVQDGRSFLEATVKLPNDVVKIATTHLPFTPDFRTSEHKLAIAERVLKLTSGEVENYILAGDMNATPRSKVGLVLRQGLKNAGPNLNENTFTTRPFKIGNLSFEQLIYRLDYVLYRGPMKAVRAEIIPTELSDHLPILVEFAANQF